jgi:hypothetical protein
MLVLLIAAIVGMLFLIRKGYINPAERARTVRRAVTQRVRNTTNRGPGGSRQGGSRKVAYDVRYFLKLSKNKFDILNDIVTVFKIIGLVAHFTGFFTFISEPGQ